MRDTVNVDAGLVSSLQEPGFNCGHRGDKFRVNIVGNISNLRKSSRPRIITVGTSRTQHRHNGLVDVVPDPTTLALLDLLTVGAEYFGGAGFADRPPVMTIKCRTSFASCVWHSSRYLSYNAILLTGRQYPSLKLSMITSKRCMTSNVFPQDVFMLVMQIILRQKPCKSVSPQFIVASQPNGGDKKRYLINARH